MCSSDAKFSDFCEQIVVGDPIESFGKIQVQHYIFYFWSAKKFKYFVQEE